MKDIDFDELDKAVNSLMASAPTIASTSEDNPPAEHIVTVSSTTAATAAPAVAPLSAPATVPSPSADTAVPVTIQPQPTPTTTAAPVVRKAGRFMDMVHDSSDMKPRPTVAVPSREGLTIAPRTDTLSADSVQQETASTSKPVEFGPMPDPIDMPQRPQSSAEPTSLTLSPTTPQADSYESPFLSDAKIEKRPLNATAAGAEKLEPTSETPTEPTPASSGDEPPAVPQVPELNSDLIEIESKETVPAADMTQAVDSAAASVAVAEPEKPLGPASIPQQYKATESTGDHSHAAIYDSSQYPEPVTHPAKKKSGWLWVVMVVLLLGVGAGGAVLLYNLGIIP
jgi:hypothetical protein